MTPIKINERLSNKISNMGFVCACLVVTLHADATITPDTLGWWWRHGFRTVGIGRVAVPFFFVVSAFLLAGHMEDENWWVDALKKRFRSLLVPYVIWNVLYLMMLLSLGMIASLMNLSFGENSWKGFVYMLGLNPLLCPQNPHLWFIRCLLVFVLISPVMGLVKNMKLGVVILLLLFGIMINISRIVGASDDWVLDFNKKCWAMLAYFVLGVFLRYNPIPLKVNKVFAVVILSLGFACGILNCRSMCSFIADPLRVPLMLLGLWFLIPENRWPKWLTGSSFAIYLMHGMVLMLSGILLKLFKLDSIVLSSAVGWTAMVCVAVVVTVSFRNLMLRFLPTGSTVVFGGR